MPLGVDVLRYFKRFIKGFKGDIFLAFDIFRFKFMAKQLKRRSEIAIQAMSFGAMIHTK